MITILRISVFLLFISATAQVKSSAKKIVPLVESREFFLNSATKINGKTRIDIKIDLPLNTVEWYYIFTTTPAPTNDNLNLLTQLTNFYDITGASSTIVKSLSVPDGSAPIDVFLMNQNNLANFYKKDVFGAYQYSEPGSYSEGTVKNTKSGKVIIDDIINGTIYLGIRNPSLSTGINIVFEAVAVVKVDEYDNTKWSRDSKNQLFKAMQDYFSQLNPNQNQNSVDEVAGCITDKYVHNYTPESFQEIATYEQKKIIKDFLKICDSNNLFFQN